MISFMDSKGDVKPAPPRIPSGTHWNVYHRAMREVPDLCRAMYDTIAQTVQSKFNAGDKRIPKFNLVRKRNFKLLEPED